MELTTMILGFLHDGDMTGYDIRQRIGMSFSFFSGLSFGSIYLALARLEKEGHITTRVSGEERGPRKKICRITDKGKAAFNQAMAGPLPPARLRNPYMARLYFFARLPAEKRLDLTREYLGAISENQERLESFRPHIEKKADRFQLLCFESGVRFMEDLRKNVTAIQKGLQDLDD